MSVQVSTPTANYVKQLHPNSNYTKETFDQQGKLWRFYCTSLDLGCSNYKLDTNKNSNRSTKEIYLEWVKGWKKHYADLSNLIREHKNARKLEWFTNEKQEKYREAIREKLSKKSTEDTNEQTTQLTIADLYFYNLSNIELRIKDLKKSAQHLLNARYNNKLAAYARVLRERELVNAHSALNVQARTLSSKDLKRKQMSETPSTNVFQSIFRKLLNSNSIQN